MAGTKAISIQEATCPGKRQVLESLATDPTVLFLDDAAERALNSGQYVPMGCWYQALSDYFVDQAAACSPLSESHDQGLWVACLDAAHEAHGRSINAATRRKADL